MVHVISRKLTESIGEEEEQEKEQVRRVIRISIQGIVYLKVLLF